MTGLTLFLRSRRVPAVLLALIVLAVVGRTVGALTFRVGSTEPLSVPWATLVPLLQAGVVASVVVSVQASAERTAARRIDSVQLAVVGALLGIALLLTSWSASTLTGPTTVLSCNRNVVGYLGLALASARLLGAGLLWVAPLLTAVTALTAGETSGAGRVWAWVIQSDGDPVALSVAAALFALGVVAARHVVDR
jgi:hypothetical protein